ncbi:protein spaetzle-like isoform X2 [Harmonia axyridis]|nr:protein spaetzle-like isoform X2 [Harmonia axyridis]
MHLNQEVDKPRDDLQKKNKFIPEVDLSKCPGDTFCEEAENYPYTEVDHQLAQAGEAEYKFMFGVDEIELATKMDHSMDRVDVGGTDPHSVIRPICESKTKVIFPRIAKNKYQQWKYVVNQGVERVQGIAVEWCSGMGRQCSYLRSSHRYMFPVCGQKYSYRRLLSISHDGILESDIFEFPVACICYLKAYLPV